MSELPNFNQTCLISEHSFEMSDVLMESVFDEAVALRRGDNCVNLRCTSVANKSFDLSKCKQMVMSPKKRNSITIEQQKQIVDMIDANIKYKEIEKVTGVKKTTIGAIKKRRNKLVNVIALDDAADLKSRKRLRPVTHPRVDRAVYLWFLQQRDAHVPVSNEVLKEKALFFHSKMCTEAGCPFVAGNSWVTSFKSRHGLRNLKITGEKLSGDLAAIEPFKAKLIDNINDLNITLEQIYNADETALYYRMLPTRTLVHSRERNAPGRKIAKERLTITGREIKKKKESYFIEFYCVCICRCSYIVPICVRKLKDSKIICRQ